MEGRETKRQMRKKAHRYGHGPQLKSISVRKGELCSREYCTASMRCEQTIEHRIIEPRRQRRQGPPPAVSHRQ